MYFFNTALFEQKGLKAPEWGYTTDQFLADALKIGGTRQVREFLFKFPYVGKVTRLNQELYDQIYLKRIAKGDIKKKLDETVPMAQKVIDEERAKLKL